MENTTGMLSLAGEWRFQMDPARRGVQEQWPKRLLKDFIQLPGTVEEKGCGNSGKKNLKNYNHRHEYVGYAWYQKEVSIPEHWAGKTFLLFLERCCWESTAWFDGDKLGTQNSLVAPHVYKIGNALPGRHTVTILVDNSNSKGIETVFDEEGYTYRDLTTIYSDRKKLNCGGHHIRCLEPAWNGIVGRIELQARDMVSIGQVDVFPNADRSSAEIHIEIENNLMLQEAAKFVFTFCEYGCTIPLSTLVQHCQAMSGSTQHFYTLPLPPGLLPWDEFQQHLYQLEVQLTTESGCFDRKTVPVAFRWLTTEKNRICVNGNTVFFRGEIENCTFPLTHYPPMEKEAWRHIFFQAKEYGINLFRFHTFCPPEAAFCAADEAGIYIQAEVPGTSCPMQEEDETVTEYLFSELKAILKNYGNHPSLAFISMGNEQFVFPHGPEFHQLMSTHLQKLKEKVAYGQKNDPRHLYTCTSHPYTDDRNDDFYVSAWSPAGWRARYHMSEKEFQYKGSWEFFTVGIRWGGSDPLKTSFYCMVSPTLDHDYSAALEGLEKPFISHEIGQWEVFPDVLRDIPKFTGVTEPGNFMLIRDSLKEHGLLNRADDFVRASGALAALLYRDEIETNMKTPQSSGFHLLQLTDYPGQGTSTVGMLDLFWNSKGIVEPDRWRMFCAASAILLRSPQRVWPEPDKFTASVEVANYTNRSFSDVTVEWRLTIASEAVCVACGSWKHVSIPAGHVTVVGSISPEHISILQAEKMILSVSIPQESLANQWEMWFYPSLPHEEFNVPVYDHWCEEVSMLLSQGKNVLLTPGEQALNDSLAGVFTTVFWNPQMKKQTGTMGIYCMEKHPAFAAFPTEYHTNWQWWDILQNSRAMVLEGIDIDPFVYVIDSYVTNRKLALAFEASVGGGNLLVCSVDFEHDMANRPASRQLKYSLLKYMCSERFHPSQHMELEDLYKLFPRFSKNV